MITYSLGDIKKDSPLYILFNDDKVVWYKRTFRGSRVICRSLITGRFINHSIAKVAITYSISNALIFEIY